MKPMYTWVFLQDVKRLTHV